MKKSGIVLCCFALVLIVAGVVLCLVGKGKGDVFDNTASKEDGYIVITPIESPLKYISVNYSNVTVNVYGGAESDYIETVNIEDAQINTTNPDQISITDQRDFITVALDTVTKFSGLRGFLFPGKSHSSGEKIVNIYLSGKYNMGQLKFLTENGDIQVHNLNSSTTYILQINGKGNITLDHVSTTMTTDVQTGAGNIVLDSVSCQKISGNIHTGSLYCYEEKPGEHH